MIRVIVCSANQYEDTQGIHLLDPTNQQVRNAMKDAETKGFEFVYRHLTIERNKIYKCYCDCKEGTQIPENMALDKEGKPIPL